MNATERVLRIVMKVARKPITVRELMEIYTRITGSSIPHEDLGFWVLSDYLMSIPHILSLVEENDSLDTLVISKEPMKINTTGMYSLPSSETNPDMNRQTRLAEEVDNQEDQGFISVNRKLKSTGTIVEQSNTGEEKQPENYQSDHDFIDIDLGDSGDYYSYDSSIVEEENWRPPNDIVHLDHNIPRDSISDFIGKVIPVVVDQVYDPSKFWLHKDNGRLDSLTESMNSFYEKERDKYLIPESHMDIGSYCVAFTLNQYNRCSIVKIVPDASYVNVFYIDYGTLGKIPKDQIWFLTEPFSRLPAQAIRARLGNIYPPTENTPWSLKAIERFYDLVDSEPFGALVVAISNGVVEVCLVSQNNDYINAILVAEGHALFTYEEQKKAIRDTHCLPKYKNIHLFPDFEEIEKWLVPSIDEMEEFSVTDLTAEMFLLHCFWRPVDLDDHIQEKVKKVMRRQTKSVKYIHSSELLEMESMHKIMKSSCGNLLQQYDELLTQHLEGQEFDDFSDWDSDSTLEYNEERT